MVEIPGNVRFKIGFVGSGVVIVEDQWLCEGISCCYRQGITLCERTIEAITEMGRRQSASGQADRSCIP
jgi:hypothetical protein